MKSKDLVYESSLSRVWQLTKSDRPFALITAFRGEHTRKENLIRNRELAASLRQLGHGYFFVDGYWVENAGTPQETHVSEDSLFVVGDIGTDRQFVKNLVGLAARYNQDGVLIKTRDGVHIYDKTGNAGESIGQLTPGKVAQAYTRLRHQRKNQTFVFEGTWLDTGFISHLNFKDK